MLMTPGLALFYGGMVRAKNVLGTIMQSFFIVALVSILWAVVGYTLAFGPDLGGIDRQPRLGRPRGVGQAPFTDYAATIPHLAFMVFQVMFAVITPALITGAFAERMKFRGFLALHGPLVAARLQPGRALGLGRRRLDPQPGRARLRRRHRRPHQRRGGGAGRGPRDRQAPRLRLARRSARTTCR